MAKTIGLVVKNDPNVLKKADELEDWLIQKGYKVIRANNNGPQPVEPGHRPSFSAPPDLYCVFMLGGDGTLLSAARWIGDKPIPLLGIKFGEVGFLAEASEEHLYKVAGYVLDGNLKTMPRMRLNVQVWHDQKLIAQESVLNDVVINKGALARLAHMKTYINNGYLTDYRSDGLIVATPTGSTAYSLAAGGPIIHPQVPGIMITPICPFTLTNRPLIISDTAVIKIQLADQSTDIMLTFDGQVGFEIDGRHTIIVRKANIPVHLITLPDRDFFDALKVKLRWGGSRVP
ncbi:MAG: NAD(+)/NADH kinase [Desulfobacteraceae bacterium]|nr:NAD(+)/NADH kinase [Desulfobacteraceae bacterium]